MSNLAYSGLAIGGTPGSGKSSPKLPLTHRIKEHADVVEFPAGEILRELHAESGDNRPFHIWYRAYMRDPQTNIDFNTQYSDFVSDAVQDGKFPLTESRYVHFLPNKTLKVFFDAPIDVKAERGVGATNLDGTPRYPGNGVKSVEDILLKREKDEVEIGRNSWGVRYDYRDPQWYHLSVDSSKMRVIEEVNLLHEALLGNARLPEPRTLAMRSTL